MCKKKRRSENMQYWNGGGVPGNQLTTHPLVRMAVNKTRFEFRLTLKLDGHPGFICLFTNNSYK